MDEPEPDLYPPIPPLPPPQPKVPTRFSEPHFRRYESTILKFVQSYPNPLELDPSPFSPETFSTRFRDAVKGFLFNRSNLNPATHWNSLIPPSDLKTAWSHSISTHNGSKVYIGPKRLRPESYSFASGLVEPNGTVEPTRQDSLATTQGIVSLDPADDVIRSFVTLLHTKAIAGPVRLEASTKERPVNEELVKELMLTHDVDYTKVGDTIVLI